MPTVMFVELFSNQTEYRFIPDMIHEITENAMKY